ncbi:MAG: ROK family transcriptional regulator [Rhizobiales bacterium]|nr:ROK family transcriptional regulator [Hyphomicrobiales bacterium]
MVLRGTNQEFGRPYNRRIVLETVRLHAPISRGEIAKRVGLTVQTVSTIIRELEQLGFVIGSREQPRTRGYPPTALTINPSGGFAIGLHVTPVSIDAALIDLAGTVIGKKRRELRPATPKASFAAIGELTREMRQLRPHGRMLGVGMAIPGPFGVDSMSFVGPTTLQGWAGIPIAERLTEATGLTAFVGVDLAAAALGERLYGAGRELRDFYYLYFGVGLGGCMVHDGQPLRGAFGNAGEIGHIPLVPNGDPCPCGNRGCLERYLSLDAYERRSAQIGREAWLAEAAPLLRLAITTIENLFDPETIILGGLAPDNVLKDLITAATPLHPSVGERRDRSQPRLMLSAQGEDSVLRGAAALAVSGLLSPRFGAMVVDDEAMPSHHPILTPPRAT